MVAAVSERGLLALGGEGRSMLAVNCHEMIYNIVYSGVWDDIGGFESRASSRSRSHEYRVWGISSVGRYDFRWNGAESQVCDRSSIQRSGFQVEQFE